MVATCIQVNLSSYLLLVTNIINALGMFLSKRHMSMIVTFKLCANVYWLIRSHFSPRVQPTERHAKEGMWYTRAIKHVI